MLVKQITPKALDDFVLSRHKEANFLQTANWGKVYEISGDKVYYLGFYESEVLVGTALAIVKPARRGRYLEIPGGPILDWGDPALISAVFTELQKIAAENKCVFVRLRPNIADTPENRKVFEDNRLKASPMHLHAEHTVVLDLTRPEDQLLSDMRRQTRYEVRRAQKLGIKVSFSSEKSAFAEFYEVQKDTARRQNFIPSSQDFIFAQHEAFLDKARIYKAELDGKVLAYGLIIMQSPEAIYHEAASTPANHSLPGSYALQWQIIKDAKSLGIERYNLFGIAPPNSPHHRYAGVTTFKTGFGGSQLSYLPAHDLVVDTLKYQITKIIEIIRKKKRKL